MIEVTFDGSDLLRGLNELSDRVSKRVQRQALREGAEPMRQAMSAHAPHEPGTPDLRDMMVISNAKGQDVNEVAIAVGPTRRGFYGLFQEFGTARHGAQPFARPAFDETAQEALDVIVDSLWDALQFGTFRGTAPDAGDE
jgi:HK97 gp10 family phage protein